MRIGKLAGVVFIVGAVLSGSASAQAPEIAKSVHLMARFAPPPPERSQWAMTAHLVSAPYGLGEPVFADLKIKNLGSKPATLDLGSNSKNDLLVTITGPDGAAEPARLWSGGLTTVGRHVVGAGETYRQRLFLNEWNAFREAGDYSVKMALIPERGSKADDPPMAEFAVSIGPRHKAKLRALAKTFADQAIHSYGFTQLDEAELALSYVTDPVAAPQMARVLAEKPARAQMIWALARLGGPVAVSALQQAQRSNDMETRYDAIRALYAMHKGEPLEPSKPVD